MQTAMLEVARFDEVDWTRLGEHREYNFRVKHLLKGQDGARDNFRLTFSQTDTGGPQSGPRHRHTFDQFRMPLHGRTSIAPDRWLETQEIGYFPESVDYGPTDEIMDAGKMAIILQFGGASGLGYISTAQHRVAVQALKLIGDFRHGLFHWPQQHPVNPGRIQDAYEAVWEHINQRPIAYPVPRYDSLVVMRPAGYAWRPHAAQPGLMSKSLGRFTEREIDVTMVRIESGAAVTLDPRAGTQVGFVLSGDGRIGGKPVAPHSSFSTPPGLGLGIESDTEIEIVLFGLPRFDD